MINSNGQVLKVDNVSVTKVRVGSNNDAAFRALRDVLDYDEFFNGEYVMLAPDAKQPGKWCAVHRCGATVVSAACGLTFDDLSEKHAGFYSFCLDDGNIPLVSECRDSIELQLYVTLADAKILSDERPEFHCADEIKMCLNSYRNLCGDLVPDDDVLVSVIGDFAGKKKEYYGDIILSKFIRDVYNKVDDKTFFSYSSLSKYVQSDGKYTIVGKGQNTIFVKYDYGKGITASVLILPMNEDAGFFDFKKFDNAD